MKKVLITGASSGIGMEIARIFAKKGYFLVLAARREDRLKELAASCKAQCKIVKCDLSRQEDTVRLFEDNRDIDILINNAGFGVFGELDKTDGARENEMINVNIKAVHFLTKMYVKEFKRRGSGRILNVASTAAFFPGPMFSSYYASKAYVLRLSLAVREELRREKSPVKISVLCPGPVRTEFNDVAGVHFAVGSVSAQYAAKKAVRGLMRGKRIIIPGFTIKLSALLSKLSPEWLSARVVYNLQRAKTR